MVLESSGYAFTSADFFLIDEWILAFTKKSFTAMPYPYAFVHNPETVPWQYDMGIPRNFVQCAVLVRCPGTHLDGFFLHSASRFTDVLCPSLKDSAIISNVAWPTKSSQKKSKGNH